MTPDRILYMFLLTPKVMMTRNILKNTRKIALLAKASGMIPRNVVVAPVITDGPISPKAFAIRASLGMLGSCFASKIGTYSGHDGLARKVRHITRLASPSVEVSLKTCPTYSISFTRLGHEERLGTLHLEV